MDFEDLVNTSRKRTMLMWSVVFMIAFPSYFAVMPSLIDSEMVGGTNGIKGEWMISFEETTETLSETINLADEEAYDTFFDIVSEINIGYVELTVTCMDNDDPGPGFTDGMDVVTGLSGVEGDFEEQNEQGSCNGGGNSGVNIRWDVTANYTGDNITQSETTEQEIRNLWTDNGFGRGTWSATITADISSPPAPIVGDIVDSDEDYDITWTVVSYIVTINPVIEI
ncbi:MAG: hypothetical protein CMB47_02515 [Euryarchaeota archaeon]|nr:hypothetical protein [Euryarchaeota archaeon]